MEIKASGKLSYDGIKYLIHTNMFKKLNPKVGMTLFSVPCLLAFLYYLLCSIKFSSLYLPTASYLFLILYLLCLVYFFLPMVRYKKLSKFKDAVNEYTFYDDKICICSQNDLYKSSAEMKYELIERVIETRKYLFIFKDKAQAYMVEKNTITNGTIDDLRRKLIFYVGDKYRIYNY